jgi:hypothetical protein
MTGRLARIGGKVDQLIGYRHCTVEDINIDNRRQKKFGTSPLGMIRYGYDLCEQELRYLRKGYRAVRDRKTRFFDVHEAIRLGKCRHSYNGILSSNVIEHSYNVIFFLLNMHFLVEKSGYHYHAIPNYRFTFDRFRTPTPIGHFIDDFKNMTTENDCAAHAREHYASVLRSDESPTATMPVFPAIHCHVFDEHNTRELFEFIFEEVTVDVIKTDAFNDVLVLCRNTLNAAFRKKFADTIKKYPGGGRMID